LNSKDLVLNLAKQELLASRIYQKAFLSLLLLHVPKKKKKAVYMC